MEGASQLMTNEGPPAVIQRQRLSVVLDGLIEISWLATVFAQEACMIGNGKFPAHDTPPWLEHEQLIVVVDDQFEVFGC